MARLASLLPGARDLWSALRDDAEAWCEGRSPWARALLLGYLGYAGGRHLLEPLYRSWFAGLTLVLHELGHLLLMPFGRTLHLLGGSLVQLLAPAAAAAYLLWRQRDYFGFVVGLAWLAFAQYELATYVADANREALPLVGFSDAPIHDWAALLTQWRLLNHCAALALGLRVFATVTWLGAIALGTWLLLQMVRRRD